MLIDTFKDNVINNYCNHLKLIGKLSRLSSESDSPYINSRIAENIFCLVTGAKNLGRADCSADAQIGDVGVGIKTFLAENNATLQKIAEFNKDSSMIRYKKAEDASEIIKIISNLRNERIRTTKRIYGINTMIYHCIVRECNTIKICECTMDIINIYDINNIKVNKNSIFFNDDKNEYVFNLNKNTLYKRFYTENALISIDVHILEEPYMHLFHLFDSERAIIENDIIFQEKVNSNKNGKRYKSIILPLFSDKGGRKVPDRSGLNQWNANGRKRNSNEIYIPIPSWINRKFSDFFPSQKENFKLNLPNGNELVAKICQEGGKALMSNPNLKLGEWLLRDVMNLKEGDLLTYEKLQILNIDSVEIYKINEKEYNIDFRPLGSYDEFIKKNKKM